MTQTEMAPTDLLGVRIQNKTGSNIVVTDASEIPLYTSDVCGMGIPPALIVRPAELQQVSSVVKIATFMGFAITQRGGDLDQHAGPRFRCEQRRARAGCYESTAYPDYRYQSAAGGLHQ